MREIIRTNQRLHHGIARTNAMNQYGTITAL